MSVVKVLDRGTESIYSTTKGLRIGRGKTKSFHPKAVFLVADLTKSEARQIRRKLDAIGRHHQSLASL